MAQEFDGIGIPPVSPSSQFQLVYDRPLKAWRVTVVGGSSSGGAVEVLPLAALTKFARHSNTSLYQEFIGRAVPGSATSAAAWQIQRLTYSDPCFDTLETVEFAGSSGNFDQIWDNREALSYG